MRGKKNTTILLLVFLVLAVLFIVTRFTAVGRKDQTLLAGWPEIDTSQVTSLMIYPRAEQGVPIEFSKEESKWKVTKEEVTASANPISVTTALVELMNLDPEQLVARSREQWSGYQVDDSLGTRVVVMEGKKPSLDLIVGRFQYQPPPQNSYNPYGQNRVSGSTYVRLAGHSEVYAVEGFLAMSINQPFERWRDQRITKLVPSQVSHIAFDYPADSGFIAERSGNQWMVAGIQADSATFARYLNRISNKSHGEFLHGYQPEGAPVFQASFEGDNMATQHIRAYVAGEDRFALHSSINPDSWFTTSREGLFSDLFPGAGQLISED